MLHVIDYNIIIVGIRDIMYTYITFNVLFTMYVCIYIIITMIQYINTVLFVYESIKLKLLCVCVTVRFADLLEGIVGGGEGDCL